MDTPFYISLYHYAYGAIGEYLYRVVAGIVIDENKPGYKHILIHPQPGGNLSNASASTHSMYGKVESSWERLGDHFNLTINIPHNTNAAVILPHAQLNEVRENGKALKYVTGIRQLYQDGDAVVLELGSGHYQFTYQWRGK